MEKILRTVYEKPKITFLLRLISHITELYAVSFFAVLLAKLLLSSPISAIKLSVIIGVPFVIISLFRQFINAPRPYEIYKFYEIPPKKKKGVSFPSRHTFCSFAIAVACMPFSLIPSLIMLVLGVSVAVSRVLLGIHFIRDVTAGALLGVLCSALGILILF